MDYCFIPPISQLDGVPSCLVQEGLPSVLVCVSTAIHDTPVTNYHRFLIRVHSNINENILQQHLRAHDVYLKLNSFLKGKFMGLDHGTTFH